MIASPTGSMAAATVSDVTAVLGDSGSCKRMSLQARSKVSNQNDASAKDAGGYLPSSAMVRAALAISLSLSPSPLPSSLPSSPPVFPPSFLFVTKPICPSNLLARTRNLLTRLNTSFAHRTFSSRSTWAFNSECGRWILVCNREREADKVVRVD